jgi:hypothetical protein
VRLTAPPATAGAAIGPVATAQITDALPGGPKVLDVPSQASTIPAAVADVGSIEAIETAFAANVLATQAAQRQVLTTLQAFSAAPPTKALTVALGAKAGSQFAQPPMTVAA